MQNKRHFDTVLPLAKVRLLISLAVIAEKRDSATSQAIGYRAEKHTRVTGPYHSVPEAALLLAAIKSVQEPVLLPAELLINRVKRFKRHAAFEAQDGDDQRKLLCGVQGGSRGLARAVQGPGCQATTQEELGPGLSLLHLQAGPRRRSRHDAVRLLR